MTVYINHFSHTKHNRIYTYDAPLVIFYLFFPIVGCVADIRIGRYKALMITSFTALVACFAIMTGAGILHLSPSHTTISFTLLFLGEPLYLIMNRCFLIVSVCFAIDQLMDAPSSEISAFLHWNFFLNIFSWFPDIVLTCALSNYHWNNFIYISINMLCLFFLILTAHLGRKWLVIQPATENPFLLVRDVLNYTRKNKYVKKRSALTYWKDHYPSRIDLGKMKYGGPFTEEEVEDVKTLFRLILLIIVTSSFQVFVDVKSLRAHMANNKIHTKFESIVFGSSSFWTFTATLITLTLHQCLVFPLCHKHWRSMLRKIGLGFAFFLLSKVCILTLDGLGHMLTPKLSGTCLLSSQTNATTNHQAQALSLDSHLLIIAWVLNGIGYALVIPTTLEFLVAQAPYTMKGLVIGLHIASEGLFEVIGENTFLMFKPLGSARPGCEFYYYLTKVLLLLLVLLVYCFTAKWYKLRERQDIYNEYYTIEQHYEVEFDRRDAYYEAQEGWTD